MVKRWMTTRLQLAHTLRRLSAAGLALLAMGAFWQASPRVSAAPPAKAPTAPAAKAPAARLAFTVPAELAPVVEKLKGDLGAKVADTQKDQLSRGLAQAAGFWRPEDGTPSEFEAFARENFAMDKATRDELFTRLEGLLEQVDGHFNELSRSLSQQITLDQGRVLPVDEVLGGYDPSAHLMDDLFANKVAFTVLLNFPLTTLEERIAGGEKWSRQEWAEARLAQRFGRRVPASVQLELAAVDSAANQYIANYNIWMHHLVNEKGERLFKPGMRLISHWNLRDELKAAYAEKDGLTKQKMIRQVMERIVTQTIPQVVIDNPHVDWNPYTNTVTAAAAKDSDTPVPADLKISADPEPDTRYATLLSYFQANRKLDPFSPTAPSHIDRRFQDDREMPEARVTALLEATLDSPLNARIGKLIEKRLGRKLEPFDIWYSGFKAGGGMQESELDALVKGRYPTVEAFQKGLPEILQGIGFSAEKAAFLADHIVVDSARGAGHALGASRREDKAHLRTRVPKDGMNYKGFNIAIHELGHNVEQVFGLNGVDHTLMQGVPNTAFTEAMAFYFQQQDLKLLGVAKPDPQADALHAINELWATREIAGVAMVDMKIWHWMYDHPQATPKELKEATLQIAKDVWNRYFATIFGQKDVPILAIYSHIIDSGLYLPDYPLGHLISFQVYEHFQKAGNPGVEIERITRQGRLTPDVWMKNATGSPVSAEPMLRAVEKALKVVK